jgi:hypothetical protein
MKLVLDTNIFISSFFWGGNPRKIMERIIDGKDALYVADGGSPNGGAVELPLRKAAWTFKDLKNYDLWF